MATEGVEAKFLFVICLVLIVQVKSIRLTGRYFLMFVMIQCLQFGIKWCGAVELLMFIVEDIVLVFPHG